jgi:hypothetical protein
LSAGGKTAASGMDSKDSTSYMGQPSQEKKQWFLTRSGIRKDVLMAEVDGLLGPDTIVRTGSNEGVAGYWITAEQASMLNW